MNKYAVIELTNKFADGTTRKLELGNFDTDAAVTHVLALKANIGAVNNNVADIETLYLSDNGANFTGIESATLQVIEETTII